MSILNYKIVFYRSIGWVDVAVFRFALQQLEIKIS